MNDARYQKFTRTISASDIAEIYCAGNGFAILSLTGSFGVSVSFNESSAFEDFESGTGVENVAPFNVVKIKNNDGANPAVLEFAIFNGRFNDNRFNISAPIEIDDTTPVNVSVNDTGRSSTPESYVVSAGSFYTPISSKTFVFCIKNEGFENMVVELNNDDEFCLNVGEILYLNSYVSKMKVDNGEGELNGKFSILVEE